MDIRYISELELEQLYALRQAVLRIPLGLNLFDEDLTKEFDWIKIGAFNNNELIACVMLTKLSENTIKLRQMAVMENLQGKGIGAKLVAFAEHYCKKHGYKNIELHARDIATGFYTKLNYTIVGEYFLEVNIPHLKMTKKL